MFLKFYPNEKELCNEFVRRAVALDVPISTAQLQGLFVFNKDAPEAALEMVHTLKFPNHVF